jgi:transposase
LGRDRQRRPGTADGGIAGRTGGLEQENAKRPSRERESLTDDRTRIINRMKSALARLSIRGFKPELRKAPQLMNNGNFKPSFPLANSVKPAEVLAK